MELNLFEIRDLGTSEECIVLEVLQTCNLQDFLLYDETFDENGILSGIWPHMYRFDAQRVNSGDVVFLHFYRGRYRKCLIGGGNYAYHYYWGFNEDANILNNDGDTLHLIKIAEENSAKISFDTNRR